MLSLVEITAITESVRNFVFVSHMLTLKEGVPYGQIQDRSRSRRQVA